MDVWDKILFAAMIGTERASLSVADDDTPTLAARALSGDGDPSHRLLIAAAVAGTHRRAGIILPTSAAGASPFPASVDLARETRPACSTRTMIDLNWLVNESLKHKPLILEALTLLARKGKRIPHPYLPKLLDLAAVNRNVDRWLAVVVNVMGERGKWLVTVNKAWSFLHDEAIWALPVPDDPPVVTPEQEQWALKHLHAVESALIQQPTLRELTDHGAIWSRRVTETFIETLIKTCATLRSHGALSYMSEAALFIARADVGYALEAMKLGGIGAENGIASFVEMLSLRQAMLKDIAYE
ncbi:MAG: DUF5691 domain-containing protein [Chloroflexota bacterium]|nr:DUF5691 domain-containing protein [Chloroflexota bacterium]